MWKAAGALFLPGRLEGMESRLSATTCVTVFRGHWRRANDVTLRACELQPDSAAGCKAEPAEKPVPEPCREESSEQDLVGPFGLRQRPPARDGDLEISGDGSANRKRYQG